MHFKLQLNSSLSIFFFVVVFFLLNAHRAGQKHTALNLI